MKNKINKILITSIDSFTGKHLSSYLKKKGYEIYGTSLFNTSKRVYKCDITKPNDIVNVLKKIKPDFIIHLAGIAFTAHGNNDDFYKVNTIGTINILDTLVALDINPSKIILASSATVYGNQNLEVLDESLCCKPANHYGVSKYAMECLAKNYFDKLNIIITRPFNYTGVGQANHFLIPKIVQHFKENKQKIQLGNLNVSREFNDVEFIVKIYKKLLESNIKSQTVNLSSNSSIKLLDVIDMMNKIAKYKIKVTVNPKFVRKDEIKTLSGSNKKLKSLIGHIKQKDFKNTLREMFEA